MFTFTYVWIRTCLSDRACRTWIISGVCRDRMSVPVNVSAFTFVISRVFLNGFIGLVGLVFLLIFCPISNLIPFSLFRVIDAIFPYATCPCAIFTYPFPSGLYPSRLYLCYHDPYTLYLYSLFICGLFTSNPLFIFFNRGL